MPEKFMIFAVFGYLGIIFTGAAIGAYWPQNYAIDSKRICGRRFYISLLHWMAILTFLILSHPFIYYLPEAVPLSQLFRPTVYTLIMILANIGVILLAAKRTAHIKTGFQWWSPIPLILALTCAIWFSIAMANALGSPYLVWPDWRFICIAAVVYLAALVLGDMFVFLSDGLSSSAWHQTLIETTRLCALLPALLMLIIGIQIR